MNLPLASAGLSLKKEQWSAASFWDIYLRKKVSYAPVGTLNCLCIKKVCWYWRKVPTATCHRDPVAFSAHGRKYEIRTKQQLVAYKATALLLPLKVHPEHMAPSCFSSKAFRAALGWPFLSTENTPLVFFNELEISTHFQVIWTSNCGCFHLGCPPKYIELDSGRS